MDNLIFGFITEKLNFIMILKILKFLFSNEREIAPGVFWLGGVLYENRNKSTTPRPLKFKKTPKEKK